MPHSSPLPVVLHQPTSLAFLTLLAPARIAAHETFVVRDLSPGLSGLQAAYAEARRQKDDDSLSLIRMLYATKVPSGGNNDLKR